MTRTRGPLAKAPARSDVLSRVGMLNPKRRLESTLVTAMIDALRSIGCKVERRNTNTVWMPTPADDRGFRPVKFGEAGTSDITGTVPVRCMCLAGTPCRMCDGRRVIGVSLAVECKAPGARTNPKRDTLQRAYLERVRELGGIAIRAESINDVIPVVLRRMGRG